MVRRSTLHGKPKVRAGRRRQDILASGLRAEPAQTTDVQFKGGVLDA
jgi:hypothetical protein